jgi:hypothetical protein
VIADSRVPQARVWQVYAPLLRVSNGEIFGAGPFVGTATNLDARQTVKINASGHFSVVQHSDGTVTVTSDGTVRSTLFGTIFSGHGPASSTPTEM